MNLVIIETIIASLITFQADLNSVFLDFLAIEASNGLFDFKSVRYDTHKTHMDLRNFKMLRNPYFRPFLHSNMV